MAITGSSYSRNLKEKDSKESTKGGCFAGLHFFIELGVISLQKKRGIISSIESCGGSIDFVVSKQTTHVVSHPDVVGSYKVQSALSHGCLVVSESFITDCVTANRKLDVKIYLLADTPVTKQSKEVTIEPTTTAYSASALTRTYTPRVNAAIADAVFNIAALCAGLGARVPADAFPLNSIVSNMYYNAINKKGSARQSRPEPTPKIIPTPLYRELAPRPPTSSPSTFVKSTFPSRLSSPSPSIPSSTAPPSKPIAPSTSTSSYFSFSSKPLSTPTPASPSKPTTVPAPSKTVSYSYAQFEEERRKKREEEKAKRAEESTSVLKEREARRKEEEDARKKNLEDKRLELLERRKAEEEERRQKQKEISEAREKRIAEERRKREQVIEKLMQKPTHELITTSFFQSWDEEENQRKAKEEWAQYEKELEDAKRKEQEKERAAVERAEKMFAEKERKIQEREDALKLAASEKARLKSERRVEYERNKEEQELQRKREFEEKQAALLAAFLKRQERRQKKALLKVKPVEEVNYDKQKIFVGGIKLDDIKSAKLAPELSKKIIDERINCILRMFDQFGPVHQRKVFADKGHFFITYKQMESVEQAVEKMKDADVRKKLVEEAKQAFIGKNVHKLCVPHHTFYVRVPTKQRKDKKKPKEQEKKHGSDTASMDSAELATFTLVSSKTPLTQTSAAPSKLPFRPTAGGSVSNGPVTEELSAAFEALLAAERPRIPNMRALRPRPQLPVPKQQEPESISISISNTYDGLEDENASDQGSEEETGSERDSSESESDSDGFSLFD